MDWIDYREKLGIGFSDEQKFGHLVMNIRNFFATANESVSFGDYFNFCNMVGVICQVEYSQDYHAGERFKLIHNVIFSQLDAIEDFIAYFCAFLNTYRNPIPYVSKHTREDYKNLLLNMLDQAHIPFDIFEDDDGYFVFPKGAKELDDALVSEPLEWLAGYPKPHSAFVKALKQYSEATSQQASDVADLFRKALETFFQEFFGGNRALENFKNDYGAYLKSQGIPKEISGNFETLLQSYTLFINNYAKHRDATSDRVLEYIMYQTGNIIRLLITLKQEESNHAD